MNDEEKSRDQYPDTLKGLLEYSLEQMEPIAIIYDKGFEPSAIRELTVDSIEDDTVYFKDENHNFKCFELKHLRLSTDGVNKGPYLGEEWLIDNMLSDLESEIEGLDEYGIYSIHRNDSFFYVEYNSDDMDDLVSVEINEESEIYIVEAKYHSSEKTIKNTDDLLKFIMSVLERHYKTASKKEEKKGSYKSPVRSTSNTEYTRVEDGNVVVDVGGIAKSILDEHDIKLEKENTVKSSGRTIDQNIAILKENQDELEKMRSTALKKGWIKKEVEKNVTQVKNTVPAKHTNNKPNFGCLFICVVFILFICYMIF